METEDGKYEPNLPKLLGKVCGRTWRLGAGALPFEVLCACVLRRQSLRTECNLLPTRVTSISSLVGP